MVFPYLSVHLGLAVAFSTLFRPVFGNPLGCENGGSFSFSAENSSLLLGKNATFTLGISCRITSVDHLLFDIIWEHVNKTMYPDVTLANVYAVDENLYGGNVFYFYEFFAGSDVTLNYTIYKDQFLIEIVINVIELKASSNGSVFSVVAHYQNDVTEQVSWKEITLVSCPSASLRRDLVLYPNGDDLEEDYLAENTITIICKKGVMYSSDADEYVLDHAEEYCARDGRWKGYDVKCWTDQFVDVFNSSGIVVAGRPTLFVCKSPSFVGISRMIFGQRVIEREQGNAFIEVNLTSAEHGVHVQCDVTSHHNSSFNISEMIELDVIFAPEPINENHLYQLVEGREGHVVLSFRANPDVIIDNIVITLLETHFNHFYIKVSKTYHEIVLHFINVTDADFGNYSVSVTSHVPSLNKLTYNFVIEKAPPFTNECGTSTASTTRIVPTEILFVETVPVDNAQFLNRTKYLESVTEQHYMQGVVALGSILGVVLICMIALYVTKLLKRKSIDKRSDRNVADHTTETHFYEFMTPQADYEIPISQRDPNQFTLSSGNLNPVYESVQMESDTTNHDYDTMHTNQGT